MRETAIFPKLRRHRFALRPLPSLVDASISPHPIGFWEFTERDAEKIHLASPTVPVPAPVSYFALFTLAHSEFSHSAHSSRTPQLRHARA